MAPTAIDVDMVDAEPLQGIGEEALDGLGPRVNAQPAAGGIAQSAELHADQRLFALAASQRLADQHLVVAHAVEVAGIDEGYSGIERGMDGGDAFGSVRRAVDARHAHAAKTQGGNARAGRAQSTMLHRDNLLAAESGAFFAGLTAFHRRPAAPARRMSLLGRDPW